MQLHDQIDTIKTKEDLANFVEALKADLSANPHDWENPTLERFLGAMEAWIRSMENAYANMGKEFPAQPTWKTFADVLYASKIYE